MAMYYNGKKVRNLYYNGKCITRLALGKEMTRLVEGDDFVRADWLVGDGVAYLDLNIIVNVATLQYSFEFVWSRNEASTAFFCGSRSSDQHDNYTSGLVGLDYTILRLDCLSQSSNFISVNITPNVPYEVNIDCKNVTAAINGNVVAGDRTTFINPPYTFRVFDLYPKRQDVYKTFDGKISYFNLNDGTHSLNLVPCRLLRPIPATLDGNGIARNAGDCGMFDAVSGKFYGNVANSGAFTVEPSLIEGVDYERHKWLVGDKSAYFEIPINIYLEPLFVKFHPTSSDSNKIFWECLYGISSDATIEIKGMIGGSNELGIRFGIRENGVATANVLSIRNIDFLNDFTVETRYSEDNKVNFTFNGTSGTATPKIDSRANVNVQVSFKTTWCKFAKVSTDSINLTPVRLLRHLPAYLDANGKARSQFECGMLDLKTMKFYGNVAATGKFTVSDN